MSSLSFAEFDDLLGSADARRNQRMSELKKFAASKCVYLFGFGGKGRTLARQVRATSNSKVVVYDSSSKVRELAAKEGFPTAETLQDVNQTDFAVILGACQAQAEQLALVQGKHIFYQEAAYLYDAPHLASKAREFSSWINENRKDLYTVYLAVHERSREALARVLCFRLSLDPRDLAPCKRINSDMWFDMPEILSSRKYATFLDVGAYDGDTLLHAQRRLAVTRGIAVEANRALFPAIERVAECYADGILILPHAAWSHNCRLRFAEVRGGMISVSEADDGELNAGPIDDGISERVDLIKMDIEGSEIAALTGCLRTLASGPDLAIAAYHRPGDLVQLPRFLEDAGYRRPDFDFHVAHYSDCLDDTIFYYLKRGDRV